MKNDLEEIMEIAKTKYINKITIENESPAYNIPSPFTTSVWKGQNQSILEIIENEKVLFSSPTGSGKTLVFLVAARESKLPTLIIEPRKFLQKQVSEDYSIDSFTIYGKSEYRCPFLEIYSNMELPTAESAPCGAKYKKGDIMVFKWVQLDGRVMDVVFPCVIPHDPVDIGCPYYEAREEAKNILKNKGIVVCNFGNFWLYKKHAKIIIIDEADEFFRAITQGMRMEYILPSEAKSMLLEEIIRREYTFISREIASLHEAKSNANIQKEIIKISRMINKLERRKEKLKFFYANIGICFHYINKEKSDLYVDMLPNQSEVLCNRIFPNHKLCLVTATPTFSSSAFIESRYNLPSRAGIVYFPVAKMTHRYLYTQNHADEVFDIVAVQIKNIFNAFSKCFDTKKAVVHCGNLTKHAPNLKKRLEQDYHVAIHERGKQKESLDKFISGDKAQFLLITAAEYGIDFPPEINLQFVLKVPYAPRDERMLAIKKKMGKKEFDIWYDQETLLRLIQGCGRVGRGTHFGMSFILDAKFEELYNKYKNIVPDWFIERLIQKRKMEVKAKEGDIV